MYTEYVFENKEYDVACREIKAILFDIISAEEVKIAQLRQRAFLDNLDPKKAAELQSLYVQQDTCLRDVLAISDKFSKYLRRMDACSRKLKQIEERDMAQIVANIKENGSQPMVQMQPSQDVMMDSQVMSEPVMVSSHDIDTDYSGVADVAMAPPPVDEPVLETPIITETSPVEETSSTEVPVPAEEKKEDVIHEVMDTPEEVVAEESSGTSSDVVTDTPEIMETQDVVVEESTVPSTDLIPTTVAEDATVEEPLVLPVVNDSSETVSETTDAPLVVQTSEVPSEENVQNVSTEPLVMPSSDVVEGVPAVEETSTPVIEPSSEPVTIPVVTVSSDGPLEAVTGSSGSAEGSPIIPDEAAMAIPEIVPESTNQVIPTTETATTSGKLVFLKRSSDSPKAIMISERQATKLRQSLLKQEALLSAKGYFQGGVGFENQLANNGLLSPDVETKQAQIEQMMNKANELYAAGQVEEAQNMYNQISVLNSELQLERAGSAKS